MSKAKRGSPMYRAGTRRITTNSEVVRGVAEEVTLEFIELAGETWAVFPDGYALRAEECGLHATREKAEREARIRARKHNREELKELEARASHARSRVARFKADLKKID